MINNVDFCSYVIAGWRKYARDSRRPTRCTGEEMFKHFLKWLNAIIAIILRKKKALPEKSGKGKKKNPQMKYIRF